MPKNFLKKLFFIVIFQIFIFSPISAIASCEWTDMGIINGQKQYQYCDKVPGKAGWISSGSDKCSGAAPSTMQYAECCCSNVDSSINGSNINSSKPTWTIPDIKIDIGKFTKTDFKDPVECGKDAQGNTQYCINWISLYIAGIFRYAIGVVGIIAAVVLMVAGLIWLTAGGNQTRIGEAKSYIGASLTGLVIALSSYLILNQINPELTKLKSIEIAVPTKMETATSTAAGTLSSQEARNKLDKWIQVQNVATLQGVKEQTINELNFLISQCAQGVNFGCGSIVVTSCTSGEHAQGEFSHETGWKCDIGLDTSLTKYIKANYTYVGIRTSDKAPMYKNSRENCYALESDHWDIKASGTGCP